MGGNNENGPALGYRDDWNLYAVHGVRRIIVDSWAVLLDDFIEIKLSIYKLIFDE